MLVKGGAGDHCTDPGVGVDGRSSSTPLVAKVAEALKAEVDAVDQ
jgi:hypothetical protein